MILGAATFRGTVTTGAGVVATLVGTVGGTPAATLTGTVDVSRAAAAESSAPIAGARVVLGGVDVTADLYGEVVDEASIDTWRRTASFALFGKRYSPLVTERTWSRGTAVEIYHLAGIPGQVSERLAFRGVVDTCSPAGPYAWTVQCADRGILYEQGAVCLYIPPLSGYTRREVAAQLAAAFGVTVTGPAGAVWTKPLQADGRTLRELLEPLGEPELWHWRWTDDEAPTLEIYTVDLDGPTDHTWHTDDLASLPKIAPAAGVASRWVLRAATGSGVADADGDGLVPPQEYVARGEYSPAVADEQQDATGAITPTGLVPTAAEREIRRVEVEQTYSGGRLRSQQTIETSWGFFRGAKYSTASLGAGAGPNGWDYVAAYIAAGRYVNRSVEQYGTWTTVIRRTQLSYEEPSGQLLRSTTATYRRFWQAERAIRSQDSASINIVSSIDQDGQSFESRTASEPGIVAAVDLNNTWRRIDGESVLELERQVETHYEIYAPRAAVDVGTSSYYLNASGRGMAQESGSYQRVREIIRDFVPDDGHGGGTVTEQRWGWHVEPTPGGAHDWGDFSSDAVEEQWLPVGAPVVSRYAIGVDGSIVEVGGEGQVYYAGNIAARSAVEVVLDDPLLRRWFGVRSEVQEHPYVQSSAEASRLVVRRVRRASSTEVEIDRPAHLAEPGQIVALEGEVEASGVVVSRRRRRNVETGAALDAYGIEVPRL